MVTPIFFANPVITFQTNNDNPNRIIPVVSMFVLVFSIEHIYFDKRGQEAYFLPSPCIIFHISERIVLYILKKLLKQHTFQSLQYQDQHLSQKYKATHTAHFF